MNKSQDLGNISSKKPKIKILTIVLSLIIVLIIAFFSMVLVRIYRQANRLMNVEPEPFQDVAENAMPIHDTVFFQSADDLTLEGWFFNKTSAEFRGNLIFVHNIKQNRVQFGLDTADLFSDLMNSGFNVLAFDLRNSGRSSGQTSAYGYAEYQDVIAAITYMKNYTGQSETILYGVGTGTAACLLAWENLPSIFENLKVDPNSDKTIVFQEDIKGFILDTPAGSPDDFIRSDLPNPNLIDQVTVEKFVPYAIRVTAGYSGQDNLTSIISQINNPVLITRNLPDTKIDASAIDSLIDERLRLHPETTTVFEISEAGHLESFNNNQELYLSYLDDFFNIWFEDLTPDD